MGEIKSTLDIVLEKTRHLTMGGEERKIQAREDVQKKMKGLVQKFQDRKVQLDQLENEVCRLEDSFDLDCRKVLLDEVIGRIDLNQENSGLLFMLKRLCCFDTVSLEKALGNFQKEIQMLERSITESILQTLSEKWYLSGSAIIPNLEINEVWQKKSEEIRCKFRRMIKERGKA